MLIRSLQLVVGCNIGHGLVTILPEDELMANAEKLFETIANYTYDWNPGSGKTGNYFGLIPR